ncbi:MAG: DUF4416 family protein [Endomicrobium sp.]|jgi:hypothetical protein|nr:DUF4416 family protein [Endomicrobium sp.]
MGILKIPQKVKLFCGIIFANEAYAQKALKILETKLGSIDSFSNSIVFDFSNYYNTEMGNKLLRFWVSFKNLIIPNKLIEIKILTNHIEIKLATSTLKKNRLVNIDPGYVTAANVILATTKNFSHRIYLANGIYAEVTTMYVHGRFIKLPWTYNDYMSQTAVNFFSVMRTRLLNF